VIAINLNADAFGEDPFDLEGGSVAANQTIGNTTFGLPGAALVRALFSRDNDAPSIFSVMSSSLNIVQDRLTRSRLAGDPPDVTIAPKLGHIGLMQFDRAAESIAAGERAAEMAGKALADAMRRLGGNYAGPLAPTVAAS
jgi:NTE family protein